MGISQEVDPGESFQQHVTLVQIQRTWRAWNVSVRSDEKFEPVTGLTDQSDLQTLSEP